MGIVHDKYKRLLTTATENFNPASVEPFDTLEVPEHLTAVAPLPAEICEELAQFSQALHEQESSLLLVKPENYHITLAAAPTGTNRDQFKDLVENALLGQPIELDLSGVVLDSTVIAVPAFPKEKELYEARQQISNGLGGALAQGPRAELGWISLARFTRPPSTAMVDVALQSIQRDWGQVQVNTVSIYSTANKHLDGATEIATVSR